MFTLAQSRFIIEDLKVSWRQIYRIAIAGFRETLARRMLPALLLIGAAMMVGSHLFSYLSPDISLKIIYDIGLGSMAFFGALIAIMVTSTMIPEEIEKGTIYISLSRPVRRAEYTLGKFLGGVCVALSALLFLSLLLVLEVAAHKGGMEITLFKAIYYIAWELILLSALAIFVSTLPVSSFFSMFLTFFIYILGNMSNYLQHVAMRTQSFITKFLVLIAYHLVPNLEHFNVRGEIAGNNRMIPVGAIAVSKVTLYGLSYTLLFLLLAYYLMNRREV